MEFIAVSNCKLDDFEDLSTFCKLHTKYDVQLCNITILKEMYIKNQVIIMCAKDRNNLIVGFLLCYSHYSTWVGESMVIKHVLVKDNVDSIAQLLIDSAINYGKDKAIRRFDVFTSNEFLKGIVTKMNFCNLSSKEQWDCYSLSIKN